MQHSPKQPGNKRFVYLRKRHTFGAHPFPKIIECAHSIISEMSLELSVVLQYLCVLVFQHQVSEINGIFQVKLLVFVLCSTASFAPCSEP